MCSAMLDEDDEIETLLPIGSFSQEATHGKQHLISHEYVAAACLLYTSYLHAILCTYGSRDTSVPKCACSHLTYIHI